MLMTCAKCGVEEEKKWTKYPQGEWKCNRCANIGRVSKNKKKVAAEKKIARVERVIEETARLLMASGEEIAFPNAAELGLRGGAPTTEQRDWRRGNLSLYLGIVRVDLPAIVRAQVKIAMDPDHPRSVEAAREIFKYSFTGLPKEPEDVEVQGEVVHKVMEWAGWSPPQVIEGEAREVGEGE